MRWFFFIFGLVVVSNGIRADDPLFGYEGNLPASQAGWEVFDACKSFCSESIQTDRLVFRWGELGNLVNYSRRIATPLTETPLSLWIEWRFRSNVPIPLFSDDCDARLSVDYRHVHDVMYLFGDAIVSFSGSDFLLGLALDEFHVFRFESPDGVDYWYSVDGNVFYTSLGFQQDDGFSTVQFGGGGGCGETRPPDPRNEWDFIRYGTIEYGETVVAVDPPGPASGGFLDARVHAPLDRFTVTYDEANYVSVDEITVTATERRIEEVTKGNKHLNRQSEIGNRQFAPAASFDIRYSTFAIPTVVATRRLDNGPPETVEIVLNRPIPYNATTRFTFNDGTNEQTVELTFAPGDTDGDGDADLADFAALQNCFGQPVTSGLCQSLDRDADGILTLREHAMFCSELID